jgi:hypothetical protein
VGRQPNLLALYVMRRRDWTVQAPSNVVRFHGFLVSPNRGLNETYAHELFSTKNSYLKENTGWDTNTAGKKLGISPIRNDQVTQPSMTLTFDNIQLSTVTLFYMKSYGDRWESSTVAITIRLNGEELKRAELVGIHDKQTSVTYTHRD